MRTEKDRMLAGELYDASAPELQADQAATQNWLARYNAALDADAPERRRLLLERLAEVGDGAAIRPPFHCTVFTDTGRPLSSASAPSLSRSRPRKPPLDFTSVASPTLNVVLVPSSLVTCTRPSARATPCASWCSAAARAPA